MTERVEAVISYCFDDDICREKYLVEYFGEKNACACGHCDTCIDKRNRTNHTQDDVREGVMYMTQVKPRTLKELVGNLSFPADEVIDMVSFLVDEGFLQSLENGTYKNPKPLR